MSQRRRVVKAWPGGQFRMLRFSTHLTTPPGGRRLLVDSRFPRLLSVCFRRKDPWRVGCRESSQVLDRGNDRGREVRDARKVSTVSGGETTKGRGAEDEEGAKAEKKAREKGGRSADRRDRARRAGIRARFSSCRKSPRSPCLITRAGRVCQSLGAFARSRPHRSCLSVQVRLPATPQTPASGSW